MLVAVASNGRGRVNQHFGRAEEFWIYEAAPGWARFVQARNVRCITIADDADDPESVIEVAVEAAGARLIAVEATCGELVEASSPALVAPEAVLAGCAR